MQERYQKEAVPALKKDFNFRNIMEVPRIQKVVVNIGLGEAMDDSKALEAAVADLTTVTGQKPIQTKARKSIANFKLREGRIIGIMPDLQKFVAELKSQSNVPFPILSDMDNGYALSLNLTIWVGAELQKMLQERVNIPAFQGNSSWMLPIPATFVVGRDGLIRARFIDPDYRKRMTISDMLAAMRN
jgi:peroxiredoxin